PARFRRAARATACAFVAISLAVGSHVFAVEWAHRVDRRIAENPHWVFVSSWVRTFGDGGAVRMSDQFLADDLADFAPGSLVRSVQRAAFRSLVGQSSRGGRSARLAAPQ